MRIVITGGGTGGHLYPALAVLEGLKTDPDVEDLLYIGNLGRKEAELVPQFGIRFEGLTFSGMPRGFNLGIIPWTGQLLSAFLSARSLLKRFRPHAVLGTGGYVTAPVLLAALSLKVPYLVHEPDAFPGLVNRVMSRWAAEATCAFADARSRLKAKSLHVTGNPLRSRIGQVSREEALQALNLPFTLEKAVLLVTGGSQGARTLNHGVLEALPILLDDLDLQVIHQTGDKLFEEVQAQCPPDYLKHPGYSCQAFITDMASTLALAHIAIGRSGSMTLSEMYRGHIPTILVPYPYAAADHQKKNALASEKAGASLMIEDADFNGNQLVSVLKDLLSHPERLTRMQQAAASLAAPNATADVITLLKSVADGRSY